MLTLPFQLSMFQAYFCNTICCSSLIWDRKIWVAATPKKRTIFCRDNNEKLRRSIAFCKILANIYLVVTLPILKLVRLVIMPWRLVCLSKISYLALCLSVCHKSPDGTRWTIDQTDCKCIYTERHKESKTISIDLKIDEGSG